MSLVKFAKVFCLFTEVSFSMHDFVHSNTPLKQHVSFFSGMIFSMCGLMMRLKWCAWMALYCSCISFANSRITDDTKQVSNCNQRGLFEEFEDFLLARMSWGLLSTSFINTSFIPLSVHFENHPGAT